MTTETPAGMDVIWKIASPADIEAWKAAGVIVGQGDEETVTQIYFQFSRKNTFSA